MRDDFLFLLFRFSNFCEDDKNLLGAADDTAQK